VVLVVLSARHLLAKELDLLLLICMRKALHQFCLYQAGSLNAFYRAMHYSAKCSLAIACRLSVHPSVCPSVMLVDHDHIC